MEELTKNVVISFAIALAVLFVVTRFSSPTLAEKQAIRNKMANEIYSVQVLYVDQCNFNHQFDKQRIQVISTYPLKILFNNHVYLYPGVWSIEYKDNTIILKSGSWYCIGSGEKFSD